MSNTVKLNNCPQCGLAISAEAPQGLCPKCVLLGAATGTQAGVSATATSEIPSLERLAAAFPQLEVIELIGRGGMGFVFKARQPHLDRCVALKLLPDKLARDAQFAERFNREGRVLGRLNHPNIVSVYDFGQTGGFYYLLMEYVDGVNLRQAMKAGRFSPGESLSIVPEICSALQYAHEQGILHRDIKPENILLDAKGRVKIADFGIAKLVGEDQPNLTLTNTGAALGTPHYMAPEQLEKPSEVDHRADIYSLGVVFYEMLTGELPIGRFAAPSTKTPVGSSVDEVVFRTLEKDRERRFQSAGEMKTQVEGLGPTGADADVPPVLQPSPPWVKRLGALFCILGGLALLPTLLTLGSNHREFHSGALMSVTGLALIFRQRWMRGLALGLNAIGLLLPVVGLILLLFSPRSVWSMVAVGIPGLPGNHWITWLVTAIQLGAFAAGCYVLLRRDVAVLFPPRTLPGGVSTWAHLKWVFISILVIGMGFVMLWQSQRRSRSQDELRGANAERLRVQAETEALRSAAASAEANPGLGPMIQLTFTSVELRDEGGTRWLAMEYVEQVRGSCDRTFSYDARIPGFTAQTRTEGFMSDSQAGFQPVLQQRVLWKLPDALPQSEAVALRDRVARQWTRKSAVVEPGATKTLFTLTMPEGGTLSGAVGAKLQDPARRVAVNLDILLRREQELQRQFTPDHPVLKDIQGKIATAQRQLRELEQSSKVP